MWLSHLKDTMGILALQALQANVALQVDEEYVVDADEEKKIVR